MVYTPAHNANGTRSFDVRVQDKAGEYVDATYTVNVAAINDAPTVGAVGFSVLEDGGATDSSKQALSYLYHSTIFSSGTIYDAEGDALSIADVRNGKTADGQTVQVNNYTGPNAGDNRISILAPLNYNGAISFEFKVSDGHGGETWQTAYGKVNAVNDLPDITVVYLGSHAKQWVQKEFFTGRVNVLDIGMPREYTSVEMEDGRMLQAGDVQLNALPSDWTPSDSNPSADQQTADLISATDAQAAFTSQQMQTNTQRDGSPEFTGGLSAQKVLTNTAYHYVMPPDLFPSLSADAEVTVKQVNGQLLPAWLSFDAATRTLSGTPDEGQLGEWTLKVSATDSSGNTAAGIIGNELNNRLTSNTNSAANILIGGLGSDIYYLGNNDIAIENAGEGTDLVFTYTNNYTLGANIEHLYLNLTTAASLTGNDLNNNIMGNAGNDTLNGGAGDDMLNGGSGADTMAGGTGNDIYILDNLADTVIENVNEGTDILNLAITTSNGTYTLTANVENATLTNTIVYNLTGNDLNNILTGNAAANILDGGTGTDSLTGGAGNDIYIVDLTANNALQDTITEAASGGVDTVKLRGGAALATFAMLTLGNEIDNMDASATGATLLNLTGNILNNVLTGNAANNTLNGGAGTDTMLGGTGNDTYIIDNLTDTVIENANEGTDLVNVAITTAGGTYTLAANVENAALTSTVAYNFTGNDLSNTLTGNAAANTLNGALGADTMVGDAGNDTYVIDDIGDTVVESSTVTTEIDLVQSSITYQLGTNLENLTLTGTATINGTGNSLNNAITGNATNNILDGGAGDDILNGMDGDDILVGGSGNDTYVIDSAGDVITENINEGTDLVNVAIATAGGTYTLAANVENATLTNTVAYNLIGNTLNNVLIGNTAANVLNGGIGADSMRGDAGADTYVVDNAADIVSETSTITTEIDLIQSSISYTLGANLENLTLTGTSAINGTGNTLDNIITGNAANNILDGGIGNDILDGGTGTDTLIGGAGNDIYTVDLAVFNTLQDTITEAVSGGVDTLRLRGGAALTIFSTLTLGTEIDNMDASATGATLLNITGNALNNALTDNAANNTLNGGIGTDIMAGGTGNDTYIIDNQADMVIENVNEGTDILNVAIGTAGGTYTLTANVENATLTSSVAYNLTGNDLNNTLSGNAAGNILTGGTGNDVLNGLGGNDTMIGGLGDDIYNIDLLNDVITENPSEGTDLVKVAVATSGGTYTLAANIENATITSTVAFNMIGNDLNNVLIGNNSVNSLNGGIGNDVINGSLGNDVLTGGLGADTFKFSSELFSKNIDIISDFTSGTDKIALDSTVFKKLLNESDLTDNIVVRSFGAKSLDANDYLIFNNSTKALYYDADGSGLSSSPVQFATLTNITTVSASDFVVI